MKFPKTLIQTLSEINSIKGTLAKKVDTKVLNYIREKLDYKDKLCPYYNDDTVDVMLAFILFYHLHLLSDAHLTVFAEKLSDITYEKDHDLLTWLENTYPSVKGYYDNYRTEIIKVRNQLTT
ncbi:hypothetical protein [Crocosphaera sp.]|uniref:hypothetical protein n=1 Tax=Crocosphaera sp. TaxID=2729996 RepID=UPI003F2676B5|nr:hypothetical protein [Crocosphaera sp.]